MQTRLITVVLAALALLSCGTQSTIDPLPSWNATDTRAAIIDYVTATTRHGSADFIPAADRIAVFDNDGTLWAEQPMYFQLAYAVAALRANAGQHPEWAGDPDIAKILSGDPDEIRRLDEHGLVRAVLVSHSGMTNAEFRQSVADWLETDRHPLTARSYTGMIYQPMRELLDYLRANDFRVYIVSGGGTEFMRVFAESVYGVPAENVIGSSLGLEFVNDGTRTALLRKPEISFINDGPGKPVGIQRAIGRRPVFAFGNSDGDLAMLQWTDTGPYRSFQGIVHHTDAEREWAYDRESHIGRLDAALDQARRDGWTVVSMPDDWKQVFPVADAEP